MADQDDNKATEAKTEEKDTSTEDTKIESGLAAEIDAGVEDAMQEIEKERQEEAAEGGGSGDKKTLPADKDQSGDEKLGGESPDDGDGDKEDDKQGGDDDPDLDAITDELLERAVKAGLSLEDAKKYPNAGMLGHVCDRLEELSKDGGGGGDESGDTEEEEEDPLAAIPDLDPDEYDEQVVKVLEALKGIVGQQQETIKGLQAAGKSNEQSWFESKVSGLGEAFEKAFKTAPERRAALKEKFDVLSAGYKAAGKDVEQEAIFDEAVGMTLGDVKAAASDRAKAERLRDREGKFVSRPAGKTPAPTTDAFEDVAAEVDRKYFGKK